MVRRIIDDNVALVLAINGFSPEEIRKYTFRNFFLYEITFEQPSMFESIDLDGKTYGLFTTNGGEILLPTIQGKQKIIRVKIDPVRINDGIIVGGKWGHISYVRDSRPKKPAYPFNAMYPNND